ncbi:hypothetical protein FX157_12095 [Staphylococcus pseudintermedius]|nr:hypothetical protein FX157_12095 [Staphylococcus pseudintermedius]
MNTLTQAIYPIGMMLLIIGAGGAFKQVLIDGGVGGAIEKIFTDVNISPILLAWLVAAILRLALGSATASSQSDEWLVLMYSSPVSLGYHDEYPY